MPTPTSYTSAITKLVPESLAREVFSVVNVIRTEMHVSDSLTSDKQVVEFNEEMITALDVQRLCEEIHNHCHENDAILIKIKFSGAHMYYTHILSTLLTYRARSQYSPLPIVCIIDPDMPAMPTNYSKAFAWRYQLRQTGSISGALLTLGANNVKSVYGCITRNDSTALSRETTQTTEE